MPIDLIAMYGFPVAVIAAAILGFFLWVQSGDIDCYKIEAQTTASRHSWEIDKKVRKIAALKDELKKVSESFTQSEKRIDELNGSLDKAHGRINDLLGQVDNWNSSATRLENILDDKGKEIDSWKNEVSLRNDYINKLEVMVSERAEKIDQYDKVNGNQAQMIITQKVKIEDQCVAIVALKKSLEEMGKSRDYWKNECEIWQKKHKDAMSEVDKYDEMNRNQAVHDKIAKLEQDLRDMQVSRDEWEFEAREAIKKYDGLQGTVYDLNRTNSVMKDELKTSKDRIELLWNTINNVECAIAGYDDKCDSVVITECDSAP